MNKIRVYTTVEPASLAQVQAWMEAHGWKNIGPDEEHANHSVWSDGDGFPIVPDTEMDDWPFFYETLLRWLTEWHHLTDTATLHAEVTKLAKGSEP